jgi:hemoglobin
MEKKRMRLRTLSVLLFILAMLGCAGQNHGPRTLYDRLGGEPAIRAVVDDFVARAAADPKVNFARRGTPAEWKVNSANVDKLKERLVQFISVSTGATGVRYEGRDMMTVHAGMQITPAEFDAAAADLVVALDKNKVGLKEKQELMTIVASLRNVIVEQK